VRWLHGGKGIVRADGFTDDQPWGGNRAAYLQRHWIIEGHGSIDPTYVPRTYGTRRLLLEALMSDSEGHDAQAHADSATATASAPNLSITITVHMWITWARLAIEHERASALERRAMMSEHGKGGNFAEILGRETAEATLAICSAAFAMDALVSAWTQLLMDPEVIIKWTAKDTSAPALKKRAREVLKRAIGHKAAMLLANNWEVVFLQRNEVVHFGEEPGSPVPHPAGIGNTAKVNAVYSMENAIEAVDLLMTTLDQVAAADQTRLRKWISDFASTLNELKNMRSAAL
jgi:hypothetical protein